MSARLSRKREIFCQEYLVDLDGVKALHRAGYKPKNAVNGSRMASELLRDPVCKVRINERMSVRAEKVGIDAEQVLGHYVAIAMADPRKLMQHIRGLPLLPWHRSRLPVEDRTRIQRGAS